MFRWDENNFPAVFVAAVWGLIIKGLPQYIYMRFIDHLWPDRKWKTIFKKIAVEKILWSTSYFHNSTVMECDLRKIFKSQIPTEPWSLNPNEHPDKKFNKFTVLGSWSRKPRV